MTAALLQSLLFQTTNPDAFMLAVYRASDRCHAMGVSDSDFDYVIQCIADEYLKQQRNNPFSLT